MTQLFLYFLVGLEATLVEWGIFYLLDVRLGAHYALATTGAFVVSIFANWLGGRLLLFRRGDKRGIAHELIAIYAIGVMGLVANLVIMWFCIRVCQTGDMIAKILATAIVFWGNFAVRKYWLYKA